ncbi:suppressor of fused domain protein [Actinoplanes utahensis]|uniref:Suppressor of fused-like domain-containing protein n=1 Tax=Actinoplanes utahensis TaxID=1869 RepID=A0A0A6URF7_ACTUT|nr:hypothetical protein MB27_10380 [Actinoplanes utahensis]GIF32663.1 hypothetical protein Aut01nite_56490 [Actinoplanes utahensis]
MDHDLTPAARAVLEHLRRHFPGREVGVLPPAPGPVRNVVPDLHILTLNLPDHGALYVTAGVWDATRRDGHGLEFVLYVPTAEHELHVETLTMVAYHHAGGGDFVLDHGHTVAIGRPWIPGSACDHLLVSEPYPWGPELEVCDLPNGHARILWLLPITKAEKQYRHAHDLEALEQLLEDAGILPTDPYRPSVVG